MKIVSLVIGMVPLLCLASRAEALSCRPLEDRYFLECPTDRCGPLFRAFELATEPQTSPCRRHFVNSPIPEWAVPRLLEMLADRPAADAVGVFELRTRALFYRGVATSDLRLENDLASFKALSRSSEDPGGLRAQWEARAAREQRATRIWLIMSWTLIIGVLGIIGYSVRELLRHVSRPIPTSRRAIAIALSAQLTLLVLGILGSGLWFVSRTIGFIMLFVWIAELPFVAWFAVRGRRAA